MLVPNVWIKLFLMSRRVRLDVIHSSSSSALSGVHVVLRQTIFFPLLRELDSVLGDFSDSEVQRLLDETYANLIETVYSCTEKYAKKINDFARVFSENCYVYTSRIIICVLFGSNEYKNISIWFVIIMIFHLRRRIGITMYSDFLYNAKYYRPNEIWRARKQNNM